MGPSTDQDVIISPRLPDVERDVYPLLLLMLLIAIIITLTLTFNSLMTAMTDCFVPEEELMQMSNRWKVWRENFFRFMYKTGVNALC